MIMIIYVCVPMDNICKNIQLCVVYCLHSIAWHGMALGYTYIRYYPYPYMCYPFPFST